MTETAMLPAIQLMTRYKVWASELMFRSLSDLPPGEAEKQRQTRFGSMLHTMNHLYVVEDIFRHHLEGRAHGYTARNTDAPPPLETLWRNQREMDAYYLALADRLTAETADQTVHFTFVGGGEGRMTRGEILLHLANHGTYHRGFVNSLMAEIPAEPIPSDLPVYLRDVAQMRAVA